MQADRTSRKPELLIGIARRAGRPIYAQLQDGLRRAIRDRRLPPGAVIPSSRTLADDLGVSRGVVVEAYEQLIAEGYLVAAAGSATRVSDSVRAASARHVDAAQRRFDFDFRPGHPDLRKFPLDAWSRASRKALQTLKPGHLGYADPRGAIELRSTLADYLARARGVVGSANQIVVSTGCAQALSIAARVLRRRGVTRIAIEDPGHPEIRQIVLEADLQTVPVAVDDDGMSVDALERTRARAVIVSPAHQNPMGSVLTPERRQQLFRWASRVDGFIVEDDYDAEYRYDRTAVGALQGLEPARVVYVGSASKILAPALRLGWMLLDSRLLDDAVDVKRRLDNGSPVMQQLAYAQFVSAGELDRHLRRMRRLYRARRDALLQALSRHMPGWTVRGAAAGLHLVAEPPPGRDVAAIVSSAAARSVRLYSLGDYSARDRSRPGLVFGYARLTDREIAEAFRRFAASASGPTSRRRS